MDRESAIIQPENKPFIATRFLPKTGQTISYRATDDGAYEKGWNIGIAGRFVDKTLGIDDIVFDRATGLMWPARGNMAGGAFGCVFTWNNAVDYCAGLNFAGFTDWRLPNIRELLSIIDHEQINPALEPGHWTGIVNDNYWSSTTYVGNTTIAWESWLGSGSKGGTPKTNSRYILAVRKGSPG